MQDPLKQGLKLDIINRACIVNRIRMQDPLKQGLKPAIGDNIDNGEILIRMQDPLKQGLKLEKFYFVLAVFGLFECKIH